MMTPHVAILSSLDACMMRGVHSVPASRHLVHRAEYPVHAVWGKHMVIDTGGLKKGIALDLDGQLLRVMDYQHIKTARGSATIKITVRNLRTGATTEKSFQNGTRFNVATLEHRSMQYLYPDEDGNYVFMDQETYEQPVLSKGILGNSVNYIRENDIVDILTYGDEPVEINIPPSLFLTVTETEPGIKGDTATGAVKSATLETGLVVNVPLFINQGDTIKIDTRQNTYIERKNN